MEKVFKKHFHRVYWSKCSTFCGDLNFLLKGIKPSLLVDCLPPNAKVVETFLQEVLGLHDSLNSHLHSYICLLEVDHQDLIIINIPSFLDLYKRMKSPALIDICEPGAPKLMDKINTNIILEACGNLMVAVFRELSVKFNSMNIFVNFTDHFYPSLLTQSESTDVVQAFYHSRLPFLPVCHSSTSSVSTLPDNNSQAKDSSSPCINQSSNLKSMSSCVLSVSSSIQQSSSPRDSASQCPSINLCTLFGCWLQYPAVYWFRNESDYSLDMEKLTQYIVTSEMEITSSCGGNNLSHVLYSFTVPECLLHEKVKEGVTLEQFISDWFTELCQHANKRSSELSMEKKSVIMTSVIL